MGTTVTRTTLACCVLAVLGFATPVFAQRGASAAEAQGRPSWAPTFTVTFDTAQAERLRDGVGVRLTLFPPPESRPDPVKGPVLRRDALTVLARSGSALAGRSDVDDNRVFGSDVLGRPFGRKALGDSGEIGAIGQACQTTVEVPGDVVEPDAS